jgi:FlaA1/EpsC-like NDP-sugar epimerase
MISIVILFKKTNALMKKILLTGATGFIGKNLLLALQQQ